MSAHGSPLRGLHEAASDPAHEGRFGRMFKNLPVASYGGTDAENRENLAKLGKMMEADPDPAKDGADAEESAIPALNTYFGQFIDHDLTLGPEGVFQKIKDPKALIDFRTPAFDLDCVYGRGPGDQPYLFDGDKMLLGARLDGGSGAAWDLPRNSAVPARALIGDPRNDENTIVSQLQGLFLRFHNRLVDQGMNFEQAQKATQRHYQYVILNDFLPQIVDSKVLDGLKTNEQFDSSKIKFYDWNRGKGHFPYMPIEFATAAYRFGHSMIRPGYRLNDGILLPIFDVNGPAFDLRGKQAMYADRGIDWGRFIATDTRPYDGAPGSAEQKRRLQYAYKIDSSLVNPLAHLPENVAGDPPPSLATRNLLRSLAFRLPSGQSVARKMGLTPMVDDKIIIGKATGDPQDTQTPILQISPIFKDNCPLWTYILVEAAAHPASVSVMGAPNNLVSTPRLGPVGGQIVAEVFLGLMFADPTSLLGSDQGRSWKPMSPGFKLKDFVAFAAPTSSKA